jgi:hypothetical protein
MLLAPCRLTEFEGPVGRQVLQCQVTGAQVQSDCATLGDCIPRAAVSTLARAWAECGHDVGRWPETVEAQLTRVPWGDGGTAHKLWARKLLATITPEEAAAMAERAGDGTVLDLEHMPAEQLAETAARIERARDARARIVPMIDAELERIHKLGEALNKARAQALQGLRIDLRPLGLHGKRKPLTPAEREARRNNLATARAAKGGKKAEP